MIHSERYNTRNGKHIIRYTSLVMYISVFVIMSLMLMFMLQASPSSNTSAVAVTTTNFDAQLEALDTSEHAVVTKLASTYAPAQTVLPVIAVAPVDISYDEEGERGHNLTWIITGDNPTTYLVLQNGTNINNGTWQSDVPIVVEVDGLVVGSYNYTLVLTVAGDILASNTAFVTVVDTIAPAIRGPLNMNFEEGSTGTSITWYLYDRYPANFSIEQDGISILNASWEFSPWVSILTDNLVSGVYNFTIVASDSFGNVGADMVVVTVFASDFNFRQDNITQAEVDGFLFGDFFIDSTTLAGASIAVVSVGAVTILWRRR